LVFNNATLLTGDPAQPEIRNGVLGIRGRDIAWIGRVLPPGTAAARTIDATGKVLAPGLVNVHTHSILSMVRGVAADAGFAPSYTPGIPKGTQVNPEQARALAQLGALEAMLFGST